MLNIIVTVLLLLIAYIDHKTMKIPDRLNVALGICGLVSCIQNPNVVFVDRIIGAFAVSVPMYLLCLAIPDAFGGGDIKLTAVMGFYLGWKLLFTGVYLGFLIGGIQAVYLLLTKNIQMGKRAHMAFGPALCIGLWIAMVWGSELLKWYFGVFS